MLNKQAGYAIIYRNYSHIFSMCARVRGAVLITLKGMGFQMDVFMEYLVKRRSTVGMTLLKVAIAVLGVALMILLFLLSFSLGPYSFFAMVALMGVGYGGWRLLTGFSVEYEYTFTNGEIDIDKIIAQRKRKRMITVVCREVEAIGKYNPAAHKQAEYQTKIFSCADPDDAENTWYLIYRSVNFGKTLVVFTPPEKMLSAIRPFLPRLLQNDLHRS